MDDDSRVTPIGSRLGSQRLYGPAPDAPDDYQPAHPGVVSPPSRPFSSPTAPAGAAGRRAALGSTVLELCGITVLTVGCYLIAPCVGLIVAGLALMVLGIAVAR